MSYDDVSDLDCGNFGEVLARETLKIVPKQVLYGLTRKDLEPNPEIDLGRLVTACEHAKAVAIKAAMDCLRSFNDGCDESAISQALDAAFEKGKEVGKAEALDEIMFGDEDGDDGGV